MILPGMGIISEVITTMSHKSIFGYRAVAYSSHGLALVSFLVWGHHMFTSGQSTLSNFIFSLLTMATAVPSAIKMFNWVATLFKGSISLDTPMLYALGFLFTFGIGGITGIILGTLSADIHFHDTYFVVAHFHFVMVGGTITAWLAALHYWFPKMFGRRYDERVGLLGALLVFMGFLGTFVPQFLLGNAGMPRRYYAYPPEYQTLHVISTVGSWALAGGLLLILFYLLRALRWGARSESNPWGSRGYEWNTPSPPPPHNFEVTPVITHAPHDYYREEA
jgi:cytochrome c oxidase subunit 1